jgi:hypothetical protein
LVEAEQHRHENSGGAATAKRDGPALGNHLYRTQQAKLHEHPPHLSAVHNCGVTGA